MNGTDPTVFTIQNPDRIAHWRPLVHWLLVIPQLIVVMVLGIVRSILIFIAFFTVLFTKKVPKGIFDFIVMTFRYDWRVYSYYLFMRESYPPFDLTSTADADDPSLPADPARVGVAYPDDLNRWLPLVKWLLAIPHYICLFFLFIAGFFVTIWAFFAVLFTAKYPQGALDFMVGVGRWSLRVQAYTAYLTDEYPPFSLS